MAHPQIKFGTDGWRGLIADDFTFANVRTAAEAIAAYIHAKEDPAKGLCIGYDTRFGPGPCARMRRGCGGDRHSGQAGQRDYAHAGAQFRRARAWRGGRHHDYFIAQSGAVEWREVQGVYGGSGKPSIIAEIESYLDKPAARAAKPAAIEEVDFLPTYLNAIESFADLDLIRDRA